MSKDEVLEQKKKKIKVLILFEGCSASIVARGTDLTGIYESDNGRKAEQISILHVKSIKDIPLFVQLALSLFSSEHSDCTAF